MKILFVQEQGIGNMIQATPALKALKQLYPGAEIDVFGREPAIDILEGFSAVNQTITEDNLDDVESKYDLSLLSIWSNEFLKNHTDWLKKHTTQTMQMRVSQWGKHESEFHFDMVKQVGYSGEKPHPYCYVKECSTDWIEARKPYVVLSDTALPNWEKKRWPHYPELAEKFINDGYNVVFIGGDYEEKRFVREDYPDENVYTYFNKSIGKLAYLIQQSEFFVGNDSGPAHIAGAVGTKTFVIFGPTLIIKNKPLGDNVHTITMDYHCRPCQYQKWWSTCQRTECLHDLTSAKVYKFVSENSGNWTVNVSQEDNKLICFMRIKDAIENHTEEIFRQSLDSISRFVDEIVVVDNGSTDGTQEIYEEYDKITEIAHTEGYDEGRDRNLGLQMARKHGATWIFWADADHVFEDRFTRDEMGLMMDNEEASCYWFKTFQFWRSMDEYRVDQRWKPQYELTMFRNTPEVSFPHNTLYCGVQQVKGNHVYTDLAVKHYGHLTEEMTQQRYERCTKYDDSGLTFQHLKDQSRLALATWHDKVDDRFLGHPSTLIIMIHGGGDHVMLTPTIRQLKQNNPSLILGLLMHKDFFNAEVWENNPYIDQIFISDLDHHPTYWDKAIFNEEDKPVIDEDVKKIQERFRFDKVIFINLQRNKRAHRIDRLAQSVGIDKLEDRTLGIHTTEGDKDIARQFFNDCGILEGDTVITIHRGAGNAPKMWDFEQYQELVHYLSQYAKVILFDIGENEAGDGRYVEGENIFSARKLSEQSIQISAEIIRKADLHVGSDSLPMHIASAVGTPVVGLFKVSWMHETSPQTANSVCVASQPAYKMATKEWLSENKNKVIPSGLKIRAVDVIRGIKTLSERGFLAFDIPEIEDKDIPNKLFDPNDIARPVVGQIMGEMSNFYSQMKNTGLIFNSNNWFRHASFFQFTNLKKDAKVLDVGGGMSIWPFYLAAKGIHVTLLDPVTGEKHQYLANQLELPIYVYQEDITNNSLRDNFYDAISCLSVLEHIEDDTESIHEMAEVLKPGGILVTIVDFHSEYIEYPDANRTLVTDRDNQTDSRIYDRDALYERLIEPAKECGLKLVGDVDFENVDIDNENNLAVRGIYTFARLIFRKEE